MLKYLLGMLRRRGRKVTVMRIGLNLGNLITKTEKGIKILRDGKFLYLRIQNFTILLGNLKWSSKFIWLIVKVDLRLSIFQNVFYYNYFITLQLIIISGINRYGSREAVRMPMV